MDVMQGGEKDDTWKLMHWENWKINSGIGKRKIQTFNLVSLGHRFVLVHFVKLLKERQHLQPLPAGARGVTRDRSLQRASYESVTLVLLVFLPAPSCLRFANSAI